MDHRSLIRAATRDADRSRRRADRARQRHRRRRPRPQHEARRAGDPGAARRTGKDAGSLNETLKARRHHLHEHHRRLVGPGVRHLAGDARARSCRPSPGRTTSPRALAAGIAALTRLGKAEVGQKTLLDVLDPVQRLLAASDRHRRPRRPRAPVRARQRRGDRDDGRDPRPRFLSRRARARPRRPRLALDGVDHRRDLRRTL